MSRNNLGGIRFKRYPFKKALRITSSPIHPFLFTIYPILYFYQHNMHEVYPDVLIKPIIWSVLLTIVLFFTLRFFLKDLNKAALVASLVIFIFFTHGHIHNLIGEVRYRIFDFQFGVDKMLFSIWLVIIASAIFILIRNYIKSFKSINQAINTILTLLIIFSLGNVILLEYQTKRLFKSNAEISVGPNSTETNNKESIKPDIYYLIFDRYPSNKTLKEFYGFDNSAFTKFLKSRGFYIAEKAMANYPRTLPSLASSLNLTFLTEKDSALELLRNHKVGNFLKSQGYKYIHIGSWAGSTTTIPIANINLKSDERYERYLNLDEFTLKLIQTTALNPILHQIFPQEAMLDFKFQHRNRAYTQFKHIKEVVNSYESPKFVFAHILLPHDPYVFDEKCESVKPTQDELKALLKQIGCTNILIEDAVTEILNKSATPPIVILQADEGPMSDHGDIKNNIKYPFKERQSYKDADIRSIQERGQILNSIYLPDTKMHKLLYPEISPVNTFRIIFNNYFGAKYDLLPDKTFVFQEAGFLYEYDIKNQIKFIDITEQVKNTK